MKRIDLKKTGARLKALRIKKGLSINDLATKFQFKNPTTVYDWEAGRTLPSIPRLFALAKLYKIPVKSLIVTED